MPRGAFHPEGVWPLMNCDVSAKLAQQCADASRFCVYI